MSAFFSFETTKKYCKALLDCFNGIQVQKYISEEETRLITVPITFSTKDAALRFNEIEREQLLQGNYNILPRMSLALVDMNRNTETQTSKFEEVMYKDDSGIPTKYQFNRVPYDFTFSLSICARSLTDLTSIIEQILPYFNPSLNIRVRELDWLKEPTTIVVDLLSTSFDLPEDYEGLDIRIVSADLQFKLKGNIYPPVKDAKVIYHFLGLLAPVVDFSDEINPDAEDTTKIEFSAVMPRISNEEEAPIISNVIGSNIIEPTLEKSYGYKILFRDKFDDMPRFIINILEGNKLNPLITKSGNLFSVRADKKGTIKLGIQAVNKFDLQSEVFEYTIEVKNGK